MFILIHKFSLSNINAPLTDSLSLLLKNKLLFTIEEIAFFFKMKVATFSQQDKKIREVKNKNFHISHMLSCAFDG